MPIIWAKRNESLITAGNLDDKSICFYKKVRRMESSFIQLCIRYIFKNWKMPISSGFGNGVTSFATRDYKRYYKKDVDKNNMFFFLKSMIFIYQNSATFQTQNFINLRKTYITQKNIHEKSNDLCKTIMRLIPSRVWKNINVILYKNPQKHFFRIFKQFFPWNFEPFSNIFS